jgi:hypothetical protein
MGDDSEVLYCMPYTSPTLEGRFKPTMSKYSPGTYNVSIFNKAGSKVLVKSDPAWGFEAAKAYGENYTAFGPETSFVVSRVIYNSLEPGQERYAIKRENKT